MRVTNWISKACAVGFLVCCGAGYADHGAVLKTSGARGYVDRNFPLFGGFTLSNQTVVYVLVRGPSLRTLAGIPGYLDFPWVRLYDSAGLDLINVNITPGATRCERSQTSVNAAFVVDYYQNIRRHATNLVISLNFDLEGSDRVTGVVESGWISELEGNRAVSASEFNPGLRGQKFAFDLAIDQEKVGDGLARVGGSLKIRGQILNHTFSKILNLSAAGECPFYFSWDRGGAVLIGWLNLPNHPEALLGGGLVLGTTNDFSARVKILPAP